MTCPSFLHLCAVRTRRCVALLAWLTLGWLATPAQSATNYVFPGTLPAGCSGTGPIYTCGNVTLQFNDSITINSPKPATIIVTGNFTTDTNNINSAGAAADLTLNISGTLTTGFKPTIKANITAGTVVDSGGQGTITGNLTAISGNLTLGFKTSVTGNVASTGSGSVTLAQNGVYGGNISSTSGAITMGQGALISGSISSTTGAVTVAQSATVSGSITSTSGAVSLNFGSQLTGGITTTGAVTVAQNAVVTGDVSGGTGLVDLQFGAQVSGKITTSSGNIQLAQNAQALSCVKTTAPGTISLGFHASVNSVCCGSSCTSSCVVNNSNFAMPALCTPSSPAVDHYELSLPSTSISCLSATVTVTACANSSSPCTSAYTGANGKTATLGTSAGSLGSTTVTFDASGVATTNLSYPGASNGASATVTLSGEQVGASNPRKCCPNGTSCSAANSCGITFNTAGFVVAAAANGATTSIANQVAGTASGTYYLRALQTNTNNGACQAVLTGANSVNVGYECNNPTSCSASNLMGISGTTITRNNNGSVASYGAVNLTFDANGNAPFTLTFSDVGLATLWFTKTVNSVTLNGSSNAFITKPAGFTLSNVKQTAMPQTANPAAATATDPKFVKAGEAFTATVTAVTSSGAATPNYGKETSPEGVTLAPSLVLPTAGNGTVGSLSNATIAGGSFSAGAATVTNLSYSEVGVMAVVPEVADADYLGAGKVNAALQASGNIGRFIPDHFTVSPNSVTAGCSVATPFTYFGQNGVGTTFTVTAQNSANATTQNYAGTLAKLDLTSYSAMGFTASLSPSGALPAGAALSAGTPVPSGTWPAYGAPAGSGSATVTAKHIISRPTALATETLVLINAAPTDGEVPAAGAAAVSSATKLRFGRMVLQNAFGSDLLDLPMPVLAQHYVTSGGLSGFTTNVDDGCTSLAKTNVNLVNYQGGLNAGNMPVANVTSVNPPAGTLVAGVGKVVLQKPAAPLSAMGSVDVVLHLGDATTTPAISTATCPTATPASPLGSSLLAGTAPIGTSFLATNSCTPYTTNSSSFNVNPAARATLGGYKSPVIFQRENY